MLSSESLELGDELVVSTEREIGFDPRSERRQAELLQPSDLGLGK